MEVQSFPASQPVTAGGPGDAGLVPDGRGEGLADGTDVSEVPGGRVFDGEVVPEEPVGVNIAGLEAADVGRVPGGAPGDGAPLQAARPAIAAPTTASHVISVVLTP
jgi:hypothetical protein